MIVMKLEFTANRYHATPWGKGVNEGLTEWPPSPWRMLRAIVSTWKLTMPELAPERVVPILEKLASSPPSFYLPKAVEGHTRHRMLAIYDNEEKTPMVMDTFVHLQPHSPVFAIWHDLELDGRQHQDLDDILGNMPYLGRAESWVNAKLADACPCQPNAIPLQNGDIFDDGWDVVRIMVPRSPLCMADLVVGTNELRKRRRLDPDGAQWQPYVRRADCLDNVMDAGGIRRQGTMDGVQVVRFAFTNKVCPISTDVLRWGELVKSSAMSKYGNQNDRAVSGTLSGKDASGNRLLTHGHAYYIPTDENGDGHLDHLTVWAPGGLSSNEVDAIMSIRELNPGNMRGPVGLRYQSHGHVKDFRGVSPLFGSSKRWRSLTPYVLTRHMKIRGKKQGTVRLVDSPEQQIAREVSVREPSLPPLIDARTIDRHRPIVPMGSGRSSGFTPYDYYTHRRTGGGARYGGAYNFDIEFSDIVDGPLALGYACHYGLGVFIPAV